MDETKDFISIIEKFASPEVPVETIKGWFIDTPPCCLEDAIIDRGLKKALYWEMEYAFTCIPELHIDQSFVPCVLIGPLGAGKTYLAGAMARELQEKHGAKLLRLQGSDVRCSLVGVAEKIIKTAFRVAVELAPCVILIDDLEEVCHGRGDCRMDGFMRRLTYAFFEGYVYLRDSHKQVALIGTTNCPDEVDEALLNKVKVITVPLPDVQCRSQYLASRFDKIAILEEGFLLEEMAEATENFSYRDLNKLRESITLNLRRQVLETCKVLGADGKVDLAATEAAAAEALQNGSIRITRELFHQSLGQIDISYNFMYREKIKAYLKKCGM